MLIRRLSGVLVARQYVMLDYDVRVEQVEQAAALTPGLESPTVSPLQDSDWCAVRAMVQKSQTNNIMDELYELAPAPSSSARSTPAASSSAPTKEKKMTVAIRVIPCLDVDAGRVVKGINFEGLRDAGDPVELARRYNEAGADEITFLDVTASSSDRETTYDVVRRTADEVFIPLTVGGGVRTAQDVDRLLRAGADKARSTPQLSPVPR